MERILIGDGAFVISLTLIVIWFAASVINTCFRYLLGAAGKGFASLRGARVQSTKPDTVKASLGIAILLMFMLAMNITAVPAFAQSVTGEYPALVPAAVYPHSIVGQQYAPSLYFTATEHENGHLSPASDFPYDTCNLCYTPSLYFEAWRVVAYEGRKE